MIQWCAGSSKQGGGKEEQGEEEEWRGGGQEEEWGGEEKGGGGGGKKSWYVNLHAHDELLYNFGSTIKQQSHGSHYILQRGAQKMLLLKNSQVLPLPAFKD